MNKQIVPSKDLQQAVNGMGQILNARCNKYGGGIVFVCVMKGGFMFFSDLVKKIFDNVEHRHSEYSGDYITISI